MKRAFEIMEPAMKHKNLSLWIFTLLVTVSIAIPAFGQWAGPSPAAELHRLGIDTTKIDSVKSALGHPDRYVSGHAALFLAERNVTDAIPLIKARYLTVRNYGTTGSDYLFALRRLGEPDLAWFLRDFVDSVHANHKRDSWNYDVLAAVSAVRWLVELGDYSRLEFIVDVVENSPWAMADASGVLSLFVDGVDQYEKERIYAFLIRLAMTHPDASLRWGTLKGLRKFIDRQGAFDVLMDRAEQDTDALVRINATDLLAEYYGDLRVVFDLLVRRLNTAPNSFEQLYTLDHLKQLPFPEVLDVFKAFLQATANDTVKGSVESAYEEYVPPVPRPTTLVATMLDTLISYKHRVFALGWLGDKNFVNELDNGLDNAKKHLAKGDSVNTYKEVQKVQEKIQKEYDKTQENAKKNKPRDKRFVTTEGYKFLYYNAQYILDRLPDEKGKKKKK